MDTPKDGPFVLVSHRLGALPLINRFLDRIGLDAALARWLPEPDRRFKLAPSTAIRLVVINLLVGRAPLYGLGEWAAPYAPHLLGLPGGDTGWLNDDRVGRALVALFDADRASLLTDLIVGVIGEFNVDTSEMHNDSTSVSVHGQYDTADGSPQRGKPTAMVTFGHSKDHRPDQAAGVDPDRVGRRVGAHGVPARRRQHLRRPDAHPDPGRPGAGAGPVRLPLRRRLETVLRGGDAPHRRQRGPDRHRAARTRGEDKWFREWLRVNRPQWTEAIRLPGKRLGDLDRVWSTSASPLPSAEGYRVIWIHSTSKAARDTHARRTRIEAGVAAIDELATKLAGPKTRLKTRAAVEAAAAAALDKTDSARWLQVTVTETVEDSFRLSGIPHNRHTRAMHLYRQGLPLALLADYLGHASIESTRIYAKARELHRPGDQAPVLLRQRRLWCTAP